MISIPLKAVFFDMDGVITDTMSYHYRAWRKVFKDAGLDVPEIEVYLREGQPGRLTVKELFGERRLPFSQKKADEILEEKERLFKEIVRPRFVSGAKGFLRALSGQGLALALVTGTSRHEVHEILPKVLYDLFDATITGNDVHHGKPHPEPYLLALKKLNLKPHEAMVIENAPFGIRSAKQAGLTCIALETSLPKSYLKEADFIFPSFRELRRKVVFAKD